MFSEEDVDGGVEFGGVELGGEGVGATVDSCEDKLSGGADDCAANIASLRSLLWANLSLTAFLCASSSAAKDLANVCGLSEEVRC